MEPAARWRILSEASLRRFVAGRPALYRFLSVALRPRFWFFSLRGHPLNMESDTVVIRAHHALCLTKHHALGLYHPPVQLALKKIRSVSGIKVKIVVGPDDVCRVCPYWRYECCRRRAHMEKANSGRDAEFLKVLHLQDGQVLNPRELFEVMRRELILSEVKRMCEGCSPELCHDALQRKTWWQ